MKRLNNWMILSVFIIIISAMSCTPTVTTNQFAGNWKGTYTGNGDNGSWDVTIATNGNVSGSAMSAVFSQTYGATGTVSTNGQVAITFGTATSGAVFSGSLTGNTGTGTWVNNSRNPPFTGTWTGNKQ